MKTIITAILSLTVLASVAHAQPKKEVIHCVKIGKTLICTSN